MGCEEFKQKSKNLVRVGNIIGGKMQGRVVKVSGALVVADNMLGAKLYDVCLVSENELIGEIIEIKDDRVSIEVYENTDGLKVGDVVKNTNLPLSIELGPGLIGNVLDGSFINVIYNLHKSSIFLIVFICISKK